MSTGDLFVIMKEFGMENMKKLTNKERGIMDLFWQNGPMFVRELLEHYEEPRPHFNTLSTFVRRLEQVGYIGHKAVRILLPILRSHFRAGLRNPFGVPARKHNADGRHSY